MRRHLALARFLVVLCCALCFIGWSRAAPSAGEEGKKAEEAVTVPVETAVAAVRAMQRTVAVQGTLAPAEGATSTLAPLSSGRVVEVSVREGDHVTAGQVVIRLGQYELSDGARVETPGKPGKP